MRILAIETSCDETSAAVVEDGKRILSNIVASQMDVHRRFGGVVPEIASRKHVESINRVIEEALHEANTQLRELYAIAVTQGPGLVGALLIGVSAAKAIAFSQGLPLIGVHHIAGHIAANRLVTELSYPLLTLVVSGGHTELVLEREPGHYEVLGQTRDDAAGEAYDKVARTLNLPYPGGPHIDRLAHEGEPTYDLPRSWLENGSYDFSFSGLKSAVINTIHNAEQRGESVVRENLAASFQASVVEVLVEKTIRAYRESGAKHLGLAGGVAANRGLRTSLEERCKLEGIPLTVPPMALCTDNAAMIAAAAYLKAERQQFSNLTLNAEPGLSLEKWSVSTH
jgi:N6-L-threonylcarbamoyladenine synthase